jgi:hypothetical protein
VPNAPPAALRILRLAAVIAALLAVATPAFPANDIYKYVDDDGVPHYTDQWQLIPEKHRSSVQALDPSTGKIFKPESVKATPPPPSSSPQPSLARKDSVAATAPVDPPFYAGWLEQFSKLSIPLPSRLQLGVGLIGVVVIWGAFKILRVSPNPLVKLMLKGVIMVILVGAAYTLLISNLNQRISEITNDPTPQSFSGKELIQNLHGTTERAREAIKEKTTAPLEKIKEATVGGAIQARDSMNQSNLEKEKILKKIESGP